MAVPRLIANVALGFRDDTAHLALPYFASVASLGLPATSSVLSAPAKSSPALRMGFLMRVHHGSMSFDAAPPAL